MSEISKEIVSKNFIWRLLERCGAQIVTFVVSIILARLLDPSVYGEIALVTVFSSILQVFVDSGLGNALIQKKGADDLDFSSVFYFNLLFCLMFYALMYVTAPIISGFYEKNLTSVIRVLSLVIVISGIKNVQIAYVSKNMMFKKFFYSTLGGTIGASFVGIYMAYKGYGVWALVVQNVFNNFVDTIILWITVKWKPVFKFSIVRLKELFSYGWKLLVAQLFDTIYENCRSLIIGKKYSSEALAYYNKGKQFPTLVLTNISVAMDSVLFPTMSNVQDDKERVSSMLSRSIKLSSFFVIPVLLGLAGVSDSLIIILLTEKWMMCAPFMKLFCLAMVFTPISLSNLNAIKAIGNSDIYLKLEVIRKIVGIITLVTFMWFGPIFIAYSYLFNQMLGFIINSCVTKKVMNYGTIKQLKDIFPSAFASILVFVLVSILGKMNVNIYVLLFIQILCGFVSYVALSYIIKNENFVYIVTMAKEFYLKKRG